MNKKGLRTLRRLWYAFKPDGVIDPIKF